MSPLKLWRTAILVYRRAHVPSKTVYLASKKEVHDTLKATYPIQIFKIWFTSEWLKKSIFMIFLNLVPRVSSLLYLYSGIQEAVWQSDWMFAILRRYSVLRRVNSRGMSKFNIKPYSLPIPDNQLQSFSKIRKITSHFIFEAAVKVSRICNLRPFSLQTNQAYIHIKHTYQPQIIAHIPSKRLK